MNGDACFPFWLCGIASSSASLIPDDSTSFVVQEPESILKKSMNASPKRTIIPANRRIVVIVMATQRFDSESVEMRKEKISFPTILKAIS